VPDDMPRAGALEGLLIVPDDMPRAGALEGSSSTERGVAFLKLDEQN